MTIEPSNVVEWAALLTIFVTLIVATISGFWAVWVRAEENERAEWRRLEELTQIVQHGASNGLWAQKLAVDELMTLRRRRKEITYILREAASHFRNTEPQGKALAMHIDGYVNI